MRRRSALVAAGAGVLVLAGVLVFVFVQDPERYREDVIALLSEAAGRPVSAPGALTLRWRPSPTLTVRDLSVDYPQARVDIDSVRIALDSRALMVRRLQAQEVVAEGVTVRLAGGVAAAAAAVPDPAALRVGRLTLVDVRVQGDAGVERLRLERAVIDQIDHADGPRLEVDAALPQIRGRARMARRDGSIVLRQIDVHTGIGTIAGELTLAPEGERPRLTARLRSNALAVALPSRGAGEVRLFPRHILDIAPLAGIDVDARLEVGRLSLGDWRLNQVEAPLRVQSGRLELRAAAVLAEGPLSVAFTMAPDGPAARAELDVELRRADAGAALIMAGLHGAERGGRLDASMRLAGQGDDTVDLLDDLQGRARFDARDFTFRAGAAEIAASDVYAALMRVLRGEEGNRIGLECAVGRLEVEGGVVRAQRSLGLQSRAVNMLGTARVSLADERIELVLRPWPRVGLGPSARAVADSVRLRGTLASPRVELVDDVADPGGLPGAGVRGDALTEMERGLRDLTYGDTPCDRATGTVPGSVRGERRTEGSAP